MLNNRTGLAAPVKDKLVDMASGEWAYKLAGDKNQRKRLRVRLASTECGRGLFILWQVDVGVVHDSAQQVIKGGRRLKLRCMQR